MTDEILSYHEPYEIENSLLTSAFVICMFQNKMIFGYNNWRKQLEIPAGKREVGESIVENAEREFLEETHQIITSPKMIKVVKLKNQKSTIRYRAIFLTRIEELIPFVKKPDDEMDYLKLIDFNSIDSSLVDSIDFKILTYLFDNIRKEEI